MVLWHGTDLILVMSGQGNPPCCTGGREHYDGGLKMDTDGLETLHSLFAQYPGYYTNVCIHHLPSIYLLNLRNRAVTSRANLGNPA